MTTPPKHTRPFNLEHARAGAPFCRADGTEYEIIKWDRKHTQQLVGISKQDAAIHTFRVDGTESGNRPECALVMTPLGFIDGKPYFWDTEMEHVDGTKVAGHVVAYHSADGNHDQYRWPAPAPVYPETRMTLHDLQTIMGFSASYDMKAIANAALRHAIDAGQVLLPFNGCLTCDGHVVYGSVDDVEHFTALFRSLEPGAPTKAEYDQLSRALGQAERFLEQLNWTRDSHGNWSYSGCGVSPEGASARFANEQRAARDMAIAEAVRDACRNNFMDQGNPAIKVTNAYGRISNVNLDFVISTVKP